MQGLTINITLDSHATPQLIQFLREAQAEETHFLRQIQQQLVQIQQVQGQQHQQLAAITANLGQRTLDTELATAAREAKPVIEEVVFALDQFTPNQ